MRISKLFHWLYASIMLMPIFAIGAKSLYVTFNPNSKDSYYGETINESEYVQYEYNNLTNNQEYVFINNVNTNYTDSYGTNNYLACTIQSIDGASYSIDLNDVKYIRFYLTNNTRTFILLNESQVGIQNIQLNQTFTMNITYLGYVGNLEVWSYANYFYQLEYNDYSYIDNVFYYSVDQISNESLFNWANGTFLAQPLLFITNLFGVPSTSPIITILCYWFAISVIWLVFDVIMYIPLLVHRWLDKGVIE